MSSDFEQRINKANINFVDYGNHYVDNFGLITVAIAKAMQKIEAIEA
jgi:hypothetical protein